MKATLSPTLSDVLDYLMTLVQEGIGPKDARARLRLVQQRYPALEMDLVWEEELYDQSLHYDVLLHLPGNGTVSLSFCPNHALPWPLRGIHRWSERDLLRVNNTHLKVDQAIACLDFIWDKAPIINRLVNACLIQEALDKDPIHLTREELQFAMDSFRRAHKLYKAEDTYRWMERHGMTHERLEDLVADEALVAKLRDQVTIDGVEAYFGAHRADFDTAWIARLEFPDEKMAQRICEQILSGEVDFYAVAQRCFLAVECPEYISGDIFAVVQRAQVPLEVRLAVFAAAPGGLVGPIHSGDHYAVMLVLSLSPGCLNEKTRSTIQQLLFEEWLGDRRQQATIEWFWGNAARMSQAICNTDDLTGA